MKIKILQIVGLLIIIMFTGSCSRTILFTQAIRDKIQSDSIDVKEVQFYNSKEIMLQRNLSYEETRIAQGKIKFENGKFIELIIIKKNTPGICDNLGTNLLDVSFEAGENRTLRFMKNTKSHYQITALEWKDKFGRVQYDTLNYYIAPGGDKALLKVEKDYVYKVDKKQRIAPGRIITTSSPTLDK